MQKKSISLATLRNDLLKLDFVSSSGLRGPGRHFLKAAQLWPLPGEQGRFVGIVDCVVGWDVVEAITWGAEVALGYPPTDIASSKVLGAKPWEKKYKDILKVALTAQQPSVMASTKCYQNYGSCFEHGFSCPFQRVIIVFFNPSYILSNIVLMAQ